MENNMAKSAKYPTNTKKSTGLSSTRMTSRQTGKMSGAHGVTNGGGKHKQTFNASGSVGSDTRTFDRCYDKAPNNISKGMKDKY